MVRQVAVDRSSAVEHLGEGEVGLDKGQSTLEGRQYTLCTQSVEAEEAGLEAWQLAVYTYQDAVWAELEALKWVEHTFQDTAC